MVPERGAAGGRGRVLLSAPRRGGLRGLLALAGRGRAAWRDDGPAPRPRDLRGDRASAGGSRADRAGRARAPARAYLPDRAGTGAAGAAPLHSAPGKHRRGAPLPLRWGNRRKRAGWSAPAPAARGPARPGRGATRGPAQRPPARGARPRGAHGLRAGHRGGRQLPRSLLANARARTRASGWALDRLPRGGARGRAVDLPAPRARGGGADGGGAPARGRGRLPDAHPLSRTGRAGGRAARRDGRDGRFGLDGRREDQAGRGRRCTRCLRRSSPRTASA